MIFEAIRNEKKKNNDWFMVLPSSREMQMKDGEIKKEELHVKKVMQ